MATATRKTVKTERYVKVVSPLNGNGTGEIEIRIHKGRKSEINSYSLRRVPANCPAFILEKLQSDECEVYAVHFANEQDHRCSCPGFQHHGHCKHVDCLKALLAHGKL